MSHTEIQNLARILIESKAVAFSFFKEAAPAERITIAVRECDQWDQIDAEAEGNPEVRLGEDFVVGRPRGGQAEIPTSLSFKGASEAGTAVLMERLSMLGIAK
jgi:hypothetical protein